MAKQDAAGEGRGAAPSIGVAEGESATVAVHHFRVSGLGAS